MKRGVGEGVNVMSRYKGENVVWEKRVKGM